MREKIGPLLDVFWIAESLHERGLDRFIRRGSRAFSLVDAISFEVLNDHPADAVFAFDSDFDDEGFHGPGVVTIQEAAPAAEEKISYQNVKARVREDHGRADERKKKPS